METILLLANSEADGSLAKPALEALGAPKPWPPACPARSWSSGWSAKRSSPPPTASPACGAQAFLGVAGADFAAVALRHRRGCRRSHCESRPGHRHSRPGDLPLEPRAAGRSPAAGRTRGHARHRPFRQRRQAVGQPLVLSPAHGSGAAAHPAALVHPDRSRQPARLARRGRHRHRPNRPRDPAGGLQAHHSGGRARTRRRRADHPARRRFAAGRRRRLDQETGRRPGAREGGGNS